ncbi:MAG: hypothetical protein OS130_01785 [Thermodesulfobacteriota bacterium]|jgi:hypothetical protein|nr:MAG: hypothetical protein OS130_01785 [Thermodesulfobacteriota bacterium]
MFKSIKNVFYHILIFALSAAIALSLPYTGKFIADNYLTYWKLIENEKAFLISMEIAVAVLLIMLFNFLVRSWKDRKFSKIALNDMGLFLAAHKKSFRIKKRLKKFKGKQGTARDVMLIGSTGFNTFVNPESDLHQVIQNCREAKIMLLNPFGEGACVRAKSIPDPDITLEHFREQIAKSVEFLKSLKVLQKNIRLKLYDETPLFKLTVLGDYISMQYYHSGLNVQEMPEYIFKHSSNHSSLFHPFYQFFLSKWRDSNIPEYDFDSDELIYRDNSVNEVKREKLNHSFPN